MKYLSVCLLSLLISSGLLAADPVLIDFSGKLRKNTTYSFSIRTNQTRNCEMKIPGVTRYPIRRDTQEIICSGDLFFRPDENTPGVNVYDLKLTALYGNLNSIRRDFPLLSGRTIRISVKSGKAAFQLIPERNHRTMENAILGGTTPLKKQDDNTLSPEAERMLRAIFSPLHDPVSNYMGLQRKMEPRKHIPMNNTPIISALHQRGIYADNATIKSFAEYAGSTSIDRIPVHRVNLIAQGKNIPGYDFKFELSIMIPAKKKHAIHGPMRVSRKTMEIVSTLLPEENPFFGGSILETVSNDMTDLFIIPSDR